METQLPGLSFQCVTENRDQKRLWCWGCTQLDKWGNYFGPKKSETEPLGLSFMHTTENNGCGWWWELIGWIGWGGSGGGSGFGSKKGNLFVRAWSRVYCLKGRWKVTEEDGRVWGLGVSQHHGRVFVTCLVAHPFTLHPIFSLPSGLPYS